MIGRSASASVAALLLILTFMHAHAADGVTVTINARSQRPGELVVLTITPPDRAGQVRLHVFGREIDAFALEAGGWRALVGIDLDVKPGTYPISIDVDDGRLKTTYELVVNPRTFPTRRLSVDPAFVNPPASERERIDRDAKLLADVWRTPAPGRLWSSPFVRPVPEPANSRFGTRSIYNGVPRSAHGGADFPSPSGTGIHAPNAGRIVVARDLYFTGNTVIIDHGLGLFSMLAHLSAFDVSEGDTVAAGQLVGRVGATGRVTGPHLHWAVRANGARVDPLAVLALLGDTPSP
jgi:murein DD-endopeptidase MepM/ murein hydrolase activator NlpD